MGEAIDWIEPQDALRFLVRELRPERPALADAITGPIWFSHPRFVLDSGWATAAEYEVTKRAFDLFHEGRERGAIRATGVFNGEGLRSPVEPAEFARGSFSFWDRALDCSIRGHSKRAWLDVLVSRKDVRAQAKNNNKGGRPTAANWPVIEDLLRIEIKNRGQLDRENPKGWRTQADVVAWVEPVLTARKEVAGLTTIKDHVREMLVRIRDESGT